MPALVLVVTAACVFAVAYRYLSAFLSARVLSLDGTRPTPAVERDDGHDYVPTNRWVLLGHHFAAISGAGPLIGPVPAAQFGYLPGFLWLLIGVLVAGTVHDSVLLFASVRHGGRSLLHVAHEELGPVAGWLVAVFVVFLLVLTMAGASIAVVNALVGSAWGVFTVAATIPISMLVGCYLRWVRPGKVGEATVAGLALMILAVVAGPWVEQSALAPYLHLSREALSLAVPVYAFAATMLPVWTLLVPRDYLSSYVKVGTMVLLIGGVVVAHPVLRMPPVTEFVHGGGPVLPGGVWPLLFIVISCGAVSGYHSIVCCGTTPKMLRLEGDVRLIAYGSMLIESLVAICALVAVTVMAPADYYAINSSPEAFASLGLAHESLPEISSAIGEDLAGRPGGAAALAAGMTLLLSAAAGGARLMPYWYHFAIVFQGLFILTLIDAGTRAGRYLLQEVAGELWAPLRDPRNLLGMLVASAILCAAWGYLLYRGTIALIWPLFGANNQLLTAIALGIGIAMLIRVGKRRYVAYLAIPMGFLALAALSGAWHNCLGSYVPSGEWLLVALTILLAVVALAVLALAVGRGRALARAGNAERVREVEVLASCSRS